MDGQRPRAAIGARLLPEDNQAINEGINSMNVKIEEDGAWFYLTFTSSDLEQEAQLIRMKDSAECSDQHMTAKRDECAFTFLEMKMPKRYKREKIGAIDKDCIKKMKEYDDGEDERKKKYERESKKEEEKRNDELQKRLKNFKPAINGNSCGECSGLGNIEDLAKCEIFEKLLIRADGCSPMRCYSCLGLTKQRKTIHR